VDTYTPHEAAARAQLHSRITLQLNTNLVDQTTQTWKHYRGMPRLDPMQNEHTSRYKLAHARHHCILNTSFKMTMACSTCHPNLLPVQILLLGHGSKVPTITKGKIHSRFS